MGNLKILLIMSAMVLVLSLSIFFLESLIQVGLEDYSLIIWNFAVSIAIVISAATLFRYSRRKKRKKETEKKEIRVYAEPREKYRTEYY